MTVTPRTYTTVSDLVIDLEWNIRYYTAKADSLQKLALGMRFVILAGVIAEASIAYPMSQTPGGWIAITGLGLILGILAIWDALNHYARDSGILKLTALTCDELKTEAESLLRKIENKTVEPDEAESTIATIYLRWGRATDKVLSTFDKKISRRTEKEAITIMENRYALNQMGESQPDEHDTQANPSTSTSTSASAGNA